LARLIAQDDAFRATTRNGGRPAPRAELKVHPKDAPALGDARENIWPEHDRYDDDPPLIGSVVQVGEYEGRDFSDRSPNPRRGLRLFVALMGLALAGAASVAGYWLWSDALTSVDKSPVIAAPVIPKETVPPSSGAVGRLDERLRNQSDAQSVKSADRVVEEKLPEADPAPAGSQAVPPLALLYGPASPETLAPTSAAAARGSPVGPASNQPPQSNEAAATQTSPEAVKSGMAPDVTYVVQLSSQRSEAAAQITSKLLQTKYPNVFGGREPFIRRSDVGSRGVYYRVLLGPLSTIAEANQLCGSLKKSGGDCVVQKN
jgi:cell division septation protein DedD